MKNLFLILFGAFLCASGAFAVENLCDKATETIDKVEVKFKAVFSFPLKNGDQIALCEPLKKSLLDGPKIVRLTKSGTLNHYLAGIAYQFIDDNKEEKTVVYYTAILRQSGSVVVTSEKVDHADIFHLILVGKSKEDAKVTESKLTVLTKQGREEVPGTKITEYP